MAGLASGALREPHNGGIPGTIGHRGLLVSNRAAPRLAKVSGVARSLSGGRLPYRPGLLNVVCLRRIRRIVL